jgi:hypothetical protein
LLSAITRAFGRPNSAKVRSATGSVIARSSNRSSSEAAVIFGARDWVDLLAPRLGRRVGAPDVVRAGAPLRGADEREDPPADPEDRPADPEDPPADPEDPPAERVGVDE